LSGSIIFLGGVAAAVAMTAIIFGESKGHSLSFAAFISTLNMEGCLEDWLPLFLSLFDSS